MIMSILALAASLLFVLWVTWELKSKLNQERSLEDDLKSWDEWREEVKKWERNK